MTRSLFEVSRRASAVAMTLAALAFSASCGKSMMQQGDGSSYLIVGSLQAASGSTPAAFSAVLQSSASAPNDLGQVKLRMALKDTVSSLTPTDSNTITITSYDIAFENLTAGYAVPAPVTNLALTGNISTSDVTLTFVLVPTQMKAGLGGATANIKVTFHGMDQAGHSASATASIYATFAP